MSDLSLTVTLALIVARACDIREKSFNRGIAQQISAEHQSSKSIFAKMDEEALIKKLEGAYTVTISEAAGQASREHKEPLLAAMLTQLLTADFKKAKDWANTQINLSLGVTA